MIFLIALITLISLLFTIAPCRQISAYFGPGGKGAAQAPRGWRQRLRTFGMMVRNEDHPQHRPAAQIAMLLPVFFLTLAAMALILPHPR